MASLQNLRQFHVNLATVFKNFKLGQTNIHTYKHYTAILESFLSLKFWKDSRQNSDTATVYFGIETTVLIWYYHHHHCRRRLVTGLFFLVLLLNQRWSPPLRLKLHTAVLSVLCVMFQVLLLSSLSPLYRVFIHIFLRQTMSLVNTVFQLFCHYYLWCLYR